MHLVAEGEAATFIVRTKPGIRVILAERPFVLARATRCARHHRGIDQRTLLDQKAAGIELPLQLSKQPLDQPSFRQTLPEPPNRTVVRRHILERQPGEAQEADQFTQRWL